MKPINLKAGRILTQLTEGLNHPRGEGSHRRIDNTNGTYMAVVVERIGESIYSVAHYYEQNGDQMADPEMTFLKQDGRWFPCSIKMDGLGIYREGLILDENEKPTGIRPREQRDEVRFAGTWMKNIKAQQGRLAA